VEGATCNQRFGVARCRIMSTWWQFIVQSCTRCMTWVVRGGARIDFTHRVVIKKPQVLVMKEHVTGKSWSRNGERNDTLKPYLLRIPHMERIANAQGFDAG